jgi:hypothetical protein
MGIHVLYSLPKFSGDPKIYDFGSVAPQSTGTLLGGPADNSLNIGIIVDPVPANAKVSASIPADSTHFSVGLELYEYKNVPIPDWELMGGGGRNSR